VDCAVAAAEKIRSTPRFASPPWSGSREGLESPTLDYFAAFRLFTILPTVA
jgi:hypothetical protein